MGPNKLELSDEVFTKLVERIEPSPSIDTVEEKKNVHLIWTGKLYNYESPVFYFQGEYVLVKKLIFESWYGHIFNDMAVINECNDKRCVRPDHLKTRYNFSYMTYARNYRRLPAIKKKLVNVNEELMLRVFKNIDCGRLKNIDDIGRYMNVENCDAEQFISNNNWLLIYNYFTRTDLDYLRAKVGIRTDRDFSEYLLDWRFISECIRFG